MSIIDIIGDRIVGKTPLNKRRSSKWGKVRKAYLKEHPVCECCGGTKKLRVHHIHPFHLYPELELVQSNLIVLCEGGKHLNCHFLSGHLLHWSAFNPRVEKDCLKWHNKIVTRPTERVNL